MNQIYCHPCAVKSGDLSPEFDISRINITGSSEQAEKFLDHAVTGHRSGDRKVSILRLPTVENYSGLMIDAYNSGCLEIDHLGRKNLIIYCGGVIGDKYDPLITGTVAEEKFFKAVKINSETACHGFSYNFITGATNCRCGHCSKNLWDHTS